VSLHCAPAGLCARRAGAPLLRCGCAALRSTGRSSRRVAAPRLLRAVRVRGLAGLGARQVKGRRVPGRRVWHCVWARAALARGGASRVVILGQPRAEQRCAPQRAPLVAKRPERLGCMLFRAGARTALLLRECPRHRLAEAPERASRAGAQLAGTVAVGSRDQLRPATSSITRAGCAPRADLGLTRMHTAASKIGSALLAGVPPGSSISVLRASALQEVDAHCFSKFGAHRRQHPAGGTAWGPSSNAMAGH